MNTPSVPFRKRPLTYLRRQKATQAPLLCRNQIYVQKHHMCRSKVCYEIVAPAGPETGSEAANPPAL
jgi:hypothetical protein